MKQTIIFSAALQLFFSFFISQKAHAQWSQSSTAIYPTNSTKKVGIGRTSPMYALDVKGSIGLFNSSDAFVGVLSNDASGNFSVSSSMSLNGGTSKTLLFNAPGNYANAVPGRVGIGTNDPAEAQFVVKGHLNNTVAMFGQGTPGISLANAFSSIGFNSYVGKNGNNLVWKAMSAGYGAILECDPTNGWVSLLQNSSVAKNAIPTRNYSLVIAANGNVMIGTVNDHGYKLAVNGNVRAKEVRVQSNWADYVFADDYCLSPLTEVEAFIAANNHLPGIPPAREVQENGLDLADMTTKMMAKIEELTLYTIELHKQNKALQVRLEQLETGK